MKPKFKTLIQFTAAVAVLSSVSCTKNASNGLEGEPSTYSVIAYDQTQYLDIAREVSRTIRIAAITENKGVATSLSVKFSVDETLVDEFNVNRAPDKKAAILPSKAYSIEGNNVMIYPCSQQSMPARVTFTNLMELEADRYYVLPLVIESISGSDEAHIDKTSKVFIEMYFTSLDKGNGTKERPYLIISKDDLMNIHLQARPVETDDAEPTYFELKEDIDLEGEPWTAVNAVEPFNKKVHFNGNGKTISNLSCKSGDHPSMFGVLFGEVFDLNIKDADILGTTNVYGAAIVAGYLGSKNDGYTGIVHNVNVSGKIEHCAKAVGAIAGVIEKGDIYECSADIQIKGNNNYVGGIFGFDRAKVNVRNCITKGSIVCGPGIKCVGGIAGEFAQPESGIENCISLCSVTSGVSAGGIIGQANGDKSVECNPHEVLRGCIAWNTEVIANNTGVSDFSSGAIAGFCSPTNTLENCWRKHDFRLSISHPENLNSGLVFPLIDQEDADKDNPLEGINCNYDTVKNLMYNGKEAGATETASDVAKRIGWDEDIWDLSGDIPVLK